MRPLLLSICLTLACFSAMAHAAETPSFVVEAGELALEGEVQSIDNASGQITILANAYSTPNGRQEINPPKAKTLITTGKTRLFDERAGRDFDLSDILTGRSLRVVGRDVGTGKPLVARLVLWSSPAPIEPTDPDTPSVLDGLLPTSQLVHGVRLRVFDAGFESEKNLFEWGENTRPTFFFGYRIEAPAGADNEKPWWEWARFTGLLTPDNQVLVSTSAGDLGKHPAGRAMTFSTVDPRWKSVTATWEVTAPNAPTDANGKFSGYYEIKGQAPTPQKPRVEPKTAIQTAQGTIYILNSIESDFDEKTTTFSLSIEKSVDVPDVHVSTYPTNISDDKGTRFVGNSKSETTRLTMTAHQLPTPGAKEIFIGMQVEESAPDWKKADSYRTIRMKIPVAALVKANPPLLNTKRVPITYEAHNDVFEAQLEERQRSDIRWWGTLWMWPQRESEEAKTLASTLIEVENGKAITAEGHEFPVSITNTEESFFHGDNSAATPDENATNFYVDIDGDVPKEPVRLQFNTTQTKQFRHVFEMDRVPIPRPNAPLVSTPASGNGTLRLQKIVAVQGKSAQDIAALTGSNAQGDNADAIVMVFSINRVLPATIPIPFNLHIGARTLPLSRTPTPQEAYGWDGNALTGEKKGAFWTLVVPLGAAGSKPSKIYFELLERSDAEPAPAIEVKGVVLNPDVGKVEAVK